ncbi:hypothetical protein Cde04nite_07350 [Cellulomonas denverensis]|nr:hypothetical protein Cde04nite_07350 [Cellulomonas denverensis]
MSTDWPSTTPAQIQRVDRSDHSFLHSDRTSRAGVTGERIAVSWEGGGGGWDGSDRRAAAGGAGTPGRMTRGRSQE